jgi:methionine aminopeptidase
VAACPPAWAIGLYQDGLHLDQPRGLPRHSRRGTLREGDIVNIDVTVIVDGWHGDTSRMYGVGAVSIRARRRLVDVTYEALERGLAMVKPGNTTGDIGYAIQAYVEASAVLSCATSAATASARSSTTPQHPALRPRASGAVLQPACSSRSSPW